MNLDLASFLFDTKYFIWVGALYCFKFQQNSWGGGDIVFIMEELVNILEFQLDIKKIMKLWELKTSPGLQVVLSIVIVELEMF